MSLIPSALFGRDGVRRAALLTGLLLMSRIGPPAFAADAQEQNRACLRCHAMETLAYRDPQTREIRHLSVDPQALSHSVHGQMACMECHRRTYRRYPHPASPERESFSCVGCHEDDPDDATYHLRAIDAEFARSVHVAPGAKHADRFSCHSCHDPHRFEVSRAGKPIAQIVSDDNRVCLGCHERLLDPASLAHVWLPKREVHWASVRCLDCHTPPSDPADTSGRVSHRILAAEDSARGCVSCHSADARLLERLYRYRSEEDLAKRGLLSKAIFNEAYVVGMSRNRALDALSLVIIALTLLVLAAHAVGRYRVHRRRRLAP